MTQYKTFTRDEVEALIEKEFYDQVKEVPDIPSCDDDETLAEHSDYLKLLETEIRQTWKDTDFDPKFTNAFADSVLKRIDFAKGWIQGQEFQFFTHWDLETACVKDC